MAEYAWQQPDGEIAPVLTTEGYDLMVNIVGDWVRVADLVKLALKPGQFTVGPEPLTGEALDAERRGGGCPRCRRALVGYDGKGTCPSPYCPGPDKES